MLRSCIQRLFAKHYVRIDPYTVDNEFMLKTDFPQKRNQ